jgi:hypothetical protein
VTFSADAFAAPTGKPVELHGAKTVSKGAATAAGRAGQSQLALVDGSVGIVFAPAGHLRVVLMPTVNADRKVTRLDVIADPDRLRQMRFALLPD